MMSQERTERVRQIIVDYNDPRPFNDAAEMGEMLRELITLLTPDQGQQLFIFHWFSHSPPCYDCGNPGVFQSWEPGRTIASGRILCAICAANDAAEGMTITRRVPLD